MLVLKAVESGMEYPVTTPRVTVGRDPSNDIVLDDGGVSGFHAVLFFEDGVLSVSDLGSTNGTRVAGTTVVGRVPVAPWIIIEFGGMSLEVRDPDRRAPTRVMAAVSDTAAAAPGQSPEGTPVEGLSKTVRLALRSAGDYPDSVALSETLTVGRAPDSGLRLVSDTVSARHATMTLTSGTVEVTDEGSTNGTWVNGDRISRRRLRHGDRIRFDTIEYELQDPDGGLADGTRINPAVDAAPAPTRVSPAVPGGTGPDAPTRVDPVIPDATYDDLHARPTEIDGVVPQGHASDTVLDEAVRWNTEPPGSNGPTSESFAASPEPKPAPRDFASSGTPRPDDRVSSLFSMIFPHFRAFVPGIVFLALGVAVGLGFQIHAIGGAAWLSDPGQLARQSQLPAGSEGILLFGVVFQSVLQVAALFLLLRAAAGVLHVRGVDQREMFLRFLAYLGTWVLAFLAFVLAVVAVFVPLTILSATVAPGSAAYAHSAFGFGLIELVLVAAVFVLLYLRLWPPLVQVALYRVRNPIAAAWNETGQPGALKRGSWPLLGWVLLAVSPIGVLMPLIWLAGTAGLVLAGLLWIVWVVLIAPFLALLAVSRWQRIALSEAL